MRALILALFLLGCGTENDEAGTAAGCPDEQIDLTVPQVLTFCAESGGVIIIDTEQGRCTGMSDEMGCHTIGCEIDDTGSLFVGPAPIAIDCAGYHVAHMVHPLCTPPPETLEACAWLTE